jgi:hypothetical protein
MVVEMVSRGFVNTVPKKETKGFSKWLMVKRQDRKRRKDIEKGGPDPRPFSSV